MFTRNRLAALCLLTVLLSQLACEGLTTLPPRTPAPPQPTVTGTLLPALTPAEAAPRVTAAANPGPAGPLTDLFISPTGSDANPGTTREQPLQTLGEAWRRIPEGELTGAGYRLNLLPGEYPCEGNCNNYFENKTGTEARPIIVHAADGPGTVTLLGGLNLSHVHYLTLENLTLRAGGQAPMWGNNILHLENSDHVWLRGLTVAGPDPRQNPDNYDIQEVIKANQTDYLYLENSDVSGTYQTGVDFFAVQHAAVTGTRIHGTGEWGMYFKGGSAYLRVEGNEFYDCGLGFQAGEGSNLEVMRPPFLHYETYDVKFVNNLLHDIPGVALSVAGSYNVLLAYNTLYRVGYFNDGSGRGYALALFTHGARGCLDTAENGENNAAQICGGYTAQGGWGPAQPQADSLEWIPNRNVFVYNNLFYNPPGVQTLYGQFGAQAPADLPAAAQNIPSPSRVDDNLVIRGNLLWNGAADTPLSLDAEGSCQAGHPTCSAAQVMAENTINAVEPQLADPAHGDYRPVGGGNVFGVKTYAIPDFTWADAPQQPPVPPGDLSNAVAQDYAGQPRTARVPGAFGGGEEIPAAPATATEPAPTPARPPSPTSTSGTAPAGAAGSIPPGPLTLVTLGDSLTEGEGDALQQGGYPGRLLGLVQTVRPGSTLVNLGHSGWSSDALIQGDQGLPGELGQAEDAIRQAVAAGRPAVALVWIGSNDLFYLYEYGVGSDQGDAEDLARYTANLDTIFGGLQGAGAGLLVALLDDQSLRPVTQKGEAFPDITADELARMSRQVMRYNEALAAKAAQYGATPVDFYHTDIFTNPATLYSDGNHPNPAGYDRIAQMWLAALRPRLNP